MSLCRKMNDNINSLHYFINDFRIANICTNKRIIGIFLHSFKIYDIRGVG